MAVPETSNFNEADFDWVQLKKDCHVEVESKKDKLIRKITENPLVPIGMCLSHFLFIVKNVYAMLLSQGCLATFGALSYGLYNFRTGNKRMSQMMMRTRIAAQGLTLIALVLGVGMSVSKRQ